MIIVKVDFKKTPWGGLGVQYLCKPRKMRKGEPGTPGSETIWTPKERDAIRFKDEHAAREGVLAATHWSSKAPMMKRVIYVRLGKSRVDKPSTTRV